MKKYFIFIIIAICVYSCKSKQLIQQPIIDEQSPITTVDTTKIPSFPAEIIYILAREYEAIHDETKQKYHTEKAKSEREDSITIDNYLEKRLIQFYPNLAYKGMIKKLYFLSQNSIPKKQQKDLLQPTLEIKLSEKKENERFHTYVSDKDEIEFLNMTSEEIKIYRQLNALADSSLFFSLNDLENISLNDSNFQTKKQLLSDSIPFFLKENLTIPLIFSGGGSYVFYRIMQSKARAEYVSEYLYPQRTKYGMQGDAFRHIFVNVMLKRYTSEALAWLIMDIYWEKAGNNAPCDLLMDLHNNSVGRSTKYQYFRGDNLFDWQKWAKNIEFFINDTTRNATFKNWNQAMPLFLITQDKNNTDKNSYLYWNK
ncbi:MAG: hypothetical protein J6U44_05640 [Paludibacteraceae bacterium]|nr:hypothetical protein [Paludibacteraceae bacterium]MBO7316626.1 hypothetical protein [Paludibacteraceae bacterium]